MERTDAQVAQLIESLTSIAPEIAEQMVTWGAIYSTAWVVIGVILLVGGVISGLFGIKLMSRDDLNITGPILAVFGGVAMVFGVIITPLATLDLLKVLYTPDLYVFECVVRSISGGGS